MSIKHTDGLFDFIESSPSAHFCINTVRDQLLKRGFTELYENAGWDIKRGGNYFVIRNGTSLVAFRYANPDGGYQICASHSDQPSFRVKPSFGSAFCDFTRLSVERYGGAIHYSWLDRPLSVAGRVVVKTDRGLSACLVNIDRDIAIIPSVAIHLNREVNGGFAPDPKTDLIPLAALDKENLLSLIAAECGCDAECILSHDLFLYVRERGRVIGAPEGGLLLSPRLDDLQCAYASLAAFLETDSPAANPVLCIFDNEEVGSNTKQGAASTLLRDVLRRITPNEQEYQIALSKSFMVSADNAHAIHPNHPELSDRENAPKLNGGVVIKHNANQKYATDAVSEGYFVSLLSGAGIPYQHYANRADILGGSTLGSISDTVVSVPTVDIGLPQLAMHSAVETAGADDTDHMVRALCAFFRSSYADAFIK